MSPLGCEVANILGQVWAGLYHLDERALERADWSDLRWISVIIRHQDLATWDFNHLTQLVVLCHDRMIRMSIEGCGPRATRLSFWQRTSRTGSSSSRMPTIEEHVDMIRKAHGDVLPIRMHPTPQNETEVAGVKEDVT